MCFFFLFKLRERVLHFPPPPSPPHPLSLPPSPFFPLASLTLPPEPSHSRCVWFCLSSSFSLSLSTEVCVCLIIGRRGLFFFFFFSLLFKWWIVGIRSKTSPVVFWLLQKGGAAGIRPSCLAIGMWKRYHAHRSPCVCSRMCVFQANSRLKQIEKEYTQKLAKSSQVRTLKEKKQNQKKTTTTNNKETCS